MEEEQDLSELLDMEEKYYLSGFACSAVFGKPNKRINSINLVRTRVYPLYWSGDSEGKKYVLHQDIELKKISLYIDREDNKAEFEVESPQEKNVVHPDFQYSPSETIKELDFSPELRKFVANCVRKLRKPKKSKPIKSPLELGDILHELEGPDLEYLTSLIKEELNSNDPMPEPFFYHGSIYLKWHP